MATFQVKTKTIHGKNSLTYLKDIKGENIWIICDPFLVESQGMDLLMKNIDSSNQVFVFSNVIPDPPIAKVAEGVAKAGDVEAQVMIAFGGGSAIDTAKGIYYFAKVLNIAQIKQFIAIPTTSGTGSEVTQATVITDPDSKIKYPLFTKDIIPDVAILDANLVVTVPPSITANTGMDVLAHAIESYVSKGASHYTDALAEKSTYLTFHNLITCFDDGDNLEARDNMHTASTLAGMAFNCTNLGINHSIAHQLGAQFKVPHGLANALLLCPVIRYNAAKSKEAKEKYARLARVCSLASRRDTDEEAVRLLCEKITEMMEKMKIPKTLVEAGVKKEEAMSAMSSIAENALNDACLPTNPVKPTCNEIIALCIEIIIT